MILLLSSLDLGYLFLVWLFGDLDVFGFELLGF